MSVQKLSVTVALFSVASYLLACAVLKWVEVVERMKKGGGK